MLVKIDLTVWRCSYLSMFKQYARHTAATVRRYMANIRKRPSGKWQVEIRLMGTASRFRIKRSKMGPKL